jgi:hypothetical protein
MKEFPAVGRPGRFLPARTTRDRTTWGTSPSVRAQKPAAKNSAPFLFAMRQGPASTILFAALAIGIFDRFVVFRCLPF